MNKTISINISGFAFIIEENAYTELNKYLNTIRSYFTAADGVDEIMSDIEIRVAELFRERLSNTREVLDSGDVDYVISILGKPEAFIDDSAESSGTYESKNGSTRRTRRRLFRDPERKSIGGVASGIGAYFAIDPIWIRLLFILLTFGGFAGIPIYIILWIIMPEAKTAADKLEMHGEPVTAENIGKKVNETFDNVKKKVGDIADPERAAQAGRSARNGIEEFLLFIGRVLMLFLKFIVKIVGIVLIIIAVSLLVAFIFGLIGVGSMNLVTIGSTPFPMDRLIEFANLLLVPINSWNIVFPAAIIAVIIPLIALLYGGLKMLFGLKQQIKGLALGLTVIWFISAGIVFYFGMETSREFMKKEEFSKLHPLNQLQSDTLYLSVNTDPYFPEHIGSVSNHEALEMISIESDKIVYGTPKLNVVENLRDSVFEIVVFRAAHGADKRSAILRAENIDYQFHQQSNEVKFDPFYTCPKDDFLRNQSIYIEVRVPPGKSVYFAPGLDRMIDDIKNTSNTYDEDMVDQTWTMLNEGLTCLKCDPEKIRSKWRKSR